jgi:ATP-dependent RNA helicase RhlE
MSRQLEHHIHFIRFLMSFTNFGLTDQLTEAVHAVGHTEPTPIQSLAIRPALEGRDIIASAQTGTGKTAAFILPLLQRLSAGEKSHGSHRTPRALVLTPTRELAQQVQQAADAYGRFLTMRTVSIYGGVSMEPQLKVLRRGVDIVIATPGRLLDHMERRTIDLSKVEVLVLDEADRMLDMGFINDIRKIIKQVPTDRQTLLFSATINDDVTSMAANFLRDPQTVEAGERHNPAETVTQHFYSVPRELKMNVLIHALNTEAMESILVFSRTKHGADKICRRLERQGIAAVAIHSNRTQAQRERALEGFKRGKFRVLVATDIAARGIDVSGISHVINFDVPQYAEDYIHRIGRTGRAGATGDAITFVGNDERQYVRRIEQFIGKRFSSHPYPGAPVQLPEQPVQLRPEQMSTVSNEAHPRHRKPAVANPYKHPGTPSRKPMSSAAGHKPGQPKHDRKRRSHGKPWEEMSGKKKKRPPQKMETFSTHGEQRWSNY